MFAAYVAVNGLLAAGMAWCAFAEYTLFGAIPEQMAKARVLLSWMPALATVKVVALVGIVVGFWVPVVGTATVVGLAIYFVGAIVKHVTAHDSSNIGGAVFFLVLACAALALRLTASSAFGPGVLSQ